MRIPYVPGVAFHPRLPSGLPAGQSEPIGFSDEGNDETEVPAEIGAARALDPAAQYNGRLIDLPDKGPSPGNRW